jgi:hypothetical protein
MKHAFYLQYDFPVSLTALETITQNWAPELSGDAEYFFAYFSYFEIKKRVGLWDHVAVCVSPLSLLGNGSVKNPLIVATQRLRKKNPYRC